MLFLRRRREQRHSFLRWRAGRRIFCFILFLFCFPLFKERAISFSSGFSGPWDDSVRRPASSLSPTTHFASSQESTVRERYSSPRTSGQSRLGPREFGKEDHPPLLPFAAPPQVRQLCRWSRLHSVWRRGSRCPACLAGSRAQFDSATRFSSPGDGVLETSVAVRNAPVLREEIAVLLAKDAIKPVPSAEMRQGFYSPYFIVPKKGGGLRPILDLRVLNRALHKLPFKMLTHRRMIKCIQPQDWFAAIDLKDAYFHVAILPRHRPFLQCRRSLSPWTDLAFLRAGVPLEQVSRHTVVTTDASSTGWGATCNGQAASGLWTGPRLLWHINCLELWAVHLALQQFRPLLLGKHVLVRMDNTAAVSYINRLGGIRSHRRLQLAHHLLLWSHTQFKSLRALHILGQLNRAADALSHSPESGDSIPSSGRPICLPRVLPLPAVLLPD